MESTDYEKMKNRDLKTILAQKGLIVSGPKLVLVDRIRAFDMLFGRGLLKLPREIRFMILVILCSDENIDWPTPCCTHSADWVFNKTMFQQPAIIRTCRTLRAEGLPIFFDEKYHAFHFLATRDHAVQFECLKRWLHINQNHVHQHLANLRLSMTQWPFEAPAGNSYAAKVLERFLLRKDVTVTISIGRNHHDHGLRSFYEFRDRLSSCSRTLRYQGPEDLEDDDLVECPNEHDMILEFPIVAELTLELYPRYCFTKEI